MARAYFVGHLPIVFYHGVWRRGDERLRLFGGIDAGRFEADLRVLAGRFRFVGLEEILSERQPPGRDPRVVLTFDDGFDSTDEQILEILARWKVPATAFVNTRSVDYESLMWQHQLFAICALRGERRFCSELNGLLEEIGAKDRVQSFAGQIAVTRSWLPARKDELVSELWRRAEMPSMESFLGEHRPYMDWSGLRAWIDAGHAVGFHTHTHPFCSQLELADLEAEFLAPARGLAARLGSRLLPFAYPFGDRLPEHLERDLVERQAFSCLLGTGGLSRRGTPPHALERIPAEPGLDARVFGRPMIQRLRGVSARSDTDSTN